MILSDKTLKALLDEGTLRIDPFDPKCVQPASIDCRLGNHFLEIAPETTSIRLDSKVQYNEVISSQYIIRPKSFILATTQEYIKLPNGLTAFVEGRSSIGRMGLFIQNAGWVDAGFEGRITLELFNATDVPIQLEEGRRICQLVFCKMDQDADVPYQGKYVGQSKSVGSRIHEDFETKSH